MTSSAPATTSGPSVRPTAVQILAAKVSMKADRKLRRATPAQIRVIAKSDRPHQEPTRGPHLARYK